MENQNTIIVEGILSSAEYNGSRYVLSKENLDKAYLDFINKTSQINNKQNFQLYLLKDSFGNKHYFVAKDEYFSTSIYEDDGLKKLDGTSFSFELDEICKLKTICNKEQIEFKVIKYSFNFDEQFNL